MGPDGTFPGFFSPGVFFFAGVYGCLNVCGHMYVFMCMSFMLRPKVDRQHVPSCFTLPCLFNEGGSLN